jgi:2-isopropylmalate synthase
MEKSFGYRLPKAMHPEFGAAVKALCDREGREITPDEVMALFRREYLGYEGRYAIVSQKFTDADGPNGEAYVRFHGKLISGGDTLEIAGDGNGPIDAFFHALRQVGVTGYQFVDYSEHAVGAGADAKGAAYIQLKSPEGKTLFGVGLSHNVNYAAAKAVLCAVNRGLG